MKSWEVVMTFAGLGAGTFDGSGRVGGCWSRERWVAGSIRETADMARSGTVENRGRRNIFLWDLGKQRDVGKQKMIKGKKQRGG